MSNCKCGSANTVHQIITILALGIAYMVIQWIPIINAPMSFVLVNMMQVILGGTIAYHVASVSLRTIYNKIKGHK